MGESEDFDVLKQYEFIKGFVPRYAVDDPVGLKLVKEQKPVILTGSDLVGPALKWDLEYLAEHLGAGTFAVFCHREDTDKEPSSLGMTSDQLRRSSFDVSSCERLQGSSSNYSRGKEDYSGDSNPKKAKTCSRKRLNVFKYFDEKKVKNLQNKSSFNQQICREEMTFEEFMKKMHGDRSQERVYLQQPLNSTVGKQIAADFVKFNWVWAIEKQKEWEWGPLTSNLLLIGQKGNITPCHYDEQQNLFCQLQGRKRFLLFSPDHFPSLYPYPVHHPHDRQSQVDLDFPDCEKFPKFRELQGLEAMVNPGEILYIPMYWWHHVINVEDTVAINFWHKAATNSDVEYPLMARQKVAMIRNVEKMLLEALQDQHELSNLLHWMVDSRF